MAVHVRRSNPDAFEDYFVEEYPALRLKTTSNSGAFWGDGDARAQAVRHDVPTFALEAKARFTTESLKPRAGEWRKAMGNLSDERGQLKKFASSPIRLFAVWAGGDYAVTVPESDAQELVKLLAESPGADGIPEGTKDLSIGLPPRASLWDPRSRKDELPPGYRMRENAWKTLYREIEKAWPLVT